MANFTANQVGLSYPKPRNLQTKVFSVARTDSSTVKCALPKGAVICNVRVNQTAIAVTAAGAFNVGWSGATTGILNAFSMPTTSVGLAMAGTAAGTQIMVPLTQDRNIICTYTVGSSTAGGTGQVIIDYYVVGPNETFDD